MKLPNLSNLRHKAAQKDKQMTASDYEQRFIAELQSIDYEKSPLNPGDLNYKSNPEQKYGDLENTALWLVQKIANNPVNPGYDILKIDNRLMRMILLFKESIRLGLPEEAFAARQGLVKCFKEIRFALPEVLPASSEKAFLDDALEQYGQYIDAWLNLIDQAQIADRVYQNYRRLKNYTDKQRKDPEKIYKTLVAAEDSMYKAYNQAVAKIEMFLVNLWSIPIALDPYCLNEFQQRVAQLSEQIACAKRNSEVQRMNDACQEETDISEKNLESDADAYNARLKNLNFNDLVAEVMGEVRVKTLADQTGCQNRNEIQKETEPPEKNLKSDVEAYNEYLESLNFNDLVAEVIGEDRAKALNDSVNHQNSN